MWIRTGKIALQTILIIMLMLTPDVMFTISAQQQRNNNNEDEISFEASVDKEVCHLDDYLLLSISLSGNAKHAAEPSVPELTNLEIISRSRSSNISIINGQVSSSVSFVFTLRPLKEGEGLIGSSTLETGGKIYRTSPIKIKILPPSGKSRQPQRQTPAASPFSPFSIWDDFEEFFTKRGMFPSAPYYHVENPVIAETTISKNTAYVNEMLILTFTFYRAVDLYSAPVYTPPETTGFWTENLPSPKNQRQVVIKGTRYIAQDFKTAVFPNTAGRITIGPASITAQTDPFSNPITVKTKPITITVIATPEEGKPPYFKGAVGKFTLSASCDTQNAEQGKPFTITARVIGDGNIQTISQPEIENLSSENFRVLNVTQRQNIIKSENSVSGSKTFEYVIMPLKAGALKVGPLKFAYFNPSSKKYIELSNPAFEIEVKQSATGAAGTGDKLLLSPSQAKPDGDFVRISFDWRAWTKKFFNALIKPVTILTISSAVLIFAIYYGIKKYNLYLRRNPVEWRRKQAIKTARKRLGKSGVFLKSGRLKDFTAEIYQAVAKYLGDKFSFSSEGMTSERLSEVLAQKGLSEEEISKLRQFISECDMYRFTPTNITQNKASELLNMAQSIIVEMENHKL